MRLLRRRIEGVTLSNEVCSSALRFENLETSSHYFSALKDLSLDGLAIQAECLRKDFPNKLYLPKQIAKDQLDNLELDRPITLRNLDGFPWDFTQAK